MDDAVSRTLIVEKLVKQGFVRRSSVSDDTRTKGRRVPNLKGLEFRNKVSTSHRSPASSERLGTPFEPASNRGLQLCGLYGTGARLSEQECIWLDAAQSCPPFEPPQRVGSALVPCLGTIEVRVSVRPNPRGILT